MHLTSMHLTSMHLILLPLPQSTEAIRDFLVDKLKGAEKALKALMADSSALKKQHASDQEIIGYLDLRGQELEGQVLELTHRCQHLQAALDLQMGTHSHREEQLLGELRDYKSRHEKLDTAFKTQKVPQKVPTSLRYCVLIFMWSYVENAGERSQVIARTGGEFDAREEYPCESLQTAARGAGAKL